MVILVPLVLLVDRIVIVPAEIHYWYYDFFGVNGAPLLQLSQSILGFLAPTHYSTPIAEVACCASVGLVQREFRPSTPHVRHFRASEQGKATAFQ